MRRNGNSIFLPAAGSRMCVGVCVCACVYVVLACVQDLSVSGSLELKSSTVHSKLLVRDYSTTGPLYMLALLPIIT